MATVVLTHLQNPTLRDTALYHGAQAYLVKQSASAQDLDHAIQQAIISVASW
jgi:DNA-binding NarL/FixJ family response regulator